MFSFLLLVSIYCVIVVKHNIEFTFLTILNVQFSGILYVHNMCIHYHNSFLKLFVTGNGNSVPIKQ